MNPRNDFDIMIAKDVEDVEANWVPCDKVFYVDEVHKLEGIRFTRAFVTSEAIEHGHSGIFSTLYRVTKIIKGARVLHVSEWSA